MSSFVADSALTHSALRAAEAQQLRLLLEQQQQGLQSRASSFAPLFPAMVSNDEWYGSGSPLLAQSQEEDLSRYFVDEPSSQPTYFPYPSTSPPPSLPFHSIPSLKRAAPFPDSFDAPLKRHHSDAKLETTLASQYPLLSSDVVDGLFAGLVGMQSHGVLGGLDDSELGVGLGPVPQQGRQLSLGEGRDTHLRISPPVSSASTLSTLSNGSSPILPSTLPALALPMPLMLRGLSSSVSQPTSAASVGSPSQSSSSQQPTEPEGRREGVRRAKRRLTDKQRRAKIKEGLEQLRALVALHGNNSSDQASIVNSSVELLQQLVDEREALRTAVRRLRDDRAEAEREQAMQAQQRQQSQPQPQLSDTTTQANIRLLQQLQHLVAQGGIGGGGGVKGEAEAPATGLEQVILSQYFLQTLQLLSKLPRNQ